MDRPIPKAPDNIESDFEDDETEEQSDAYEDFIGFITDNYEPHQISEMITRLVATGHSIPQAAEMVGEIISHTMDILDE